MKFLIQFIPVGKISYIAIGFLFCNSINFFSKNEFVLIPLILLACFCFYKGYSKVSAVIIGFLLLFLQNFYFTSSISNSILKQENINYLRLHNPIQIRFLKELKRNFYEAEITAGDLQFRSIIKRYKKEVYLPTLLCDYKSISFKNAPEDQEYFRFLIPWDSIYLQVSESKCTRIAEEIDSKKLLRKQVENLLIRAQITDYANDIAMGLFFGDASYLDSEFKEKVREGGVLHLFAASGLHIGVFIGFLYFFAKQIPFFNYYTERIFPLLMAFSYLYLLSFPVSLVRAYIFTSVLVIGSLFFRKMKSIDLILVSSALILWIDPENFLTLSFTLSYSAVCGILFLKNFLDSLLFQKWKNFFTENFTISISASLGTYPVLLSYFKTFSFGSIFLNLLLVPLTSILLPLLYISLVLQLIYEYLWNSLEIFLHSNLYSNYCKDVSIFTFFGNILLYLAEILWTYSELFLRTLAFLSEKLSESIGFYRSVKHSFSFHIGIYLALFICIWIGFFLIEMEFFSDKNKTSKSKKIRNLISILFLFVIISFFYFGYVLFPDRIGKPSISKNVSASSDYFLVKEKDSVYLGGVCKYSHFQIQKILNQNFCDESITSIFIAEESCLSLANLCRKSTVNAKIYSTKEWKDWKLKYSFLEQGPNRFRNKFSSLIVYSPHLDSLSELQQNTKTDKGDILILFAFRLKDNAKDWNENKNVLGINPNWNFITPDEL
ncbi:MAG: ComEC/Rec2 family competence protein [Leptospiraceae bacterium]|nr:ComEC/Rec2 family competence protein [Leptospiraceae bacterium]